MTSPFSLSIWVAWALFLTPLVFRGATTDTLIFSADESEKAHALSAENSDVITGGLGELARCLLPLQPRGWEGGSMSFVMKVDPVAPNYITARFWGSDTNENRLLLFCEGKQLGYRHLGDVDIVDSGNGEPGYAGRFCYVTSPLPLEMTSGKREIHFEIRSTGPVWGYGTTFAQYQKPMTDATRGIYALYTHTDSCFMPAAAPADAKSAQELVSGKSDAAPGAIVKVGPRSTQVFYFKK